MRLLFVELSRFWARRVARVMLALVLLVVAIVMTVQIARSTEKLREQTSYVENPPAECVVEDSRGRPAVDGTCLDEWYASQAAQGYPDDESSDSGEVYPSNEGTVVEVEPGPGGPATGTYYTVLVHEDRRVNVGARYGDTLKGVGVALLFLAFVLGASFVGAEFGAASLSTQLLFEPRRWRVHLSKAAGAGLGGGLLTVAVAVALGAAMYAGSATRGVLDGLDASWWSDRALDIARIGAGSALAAAMSYAVTVVARRTVAAVGIFFIQTLLVIFIQPGTRGVWPDLVQYSPLNGLFAFTANDFGSGAGDSFYGILTLAGSAALCAVWAVGLTLASGTFFARYEIR